MHVPILALIVLAVAVLAFVAILGVFLALARADATYWFGRWDRATVNVGGAIEQAHVGAHREGYSRGWEACAAWVRSEIESARFETKAPSHYYRTGPIDALFGKLAEDDEDPEAEDAADRAAIEAAGDEPSVPYGPDDVAWDAMSPADAAKLRRAIDDGDETVDLPAIPVQARSADPRDAISARMAEVRGDSRP